MSLAAIGDTPYNLVLLLHLVTVIVGVGAAYLGPVLMRRVGEARAARDAIAAVLASVMAPALLAAGVFGGALVGLSDDAYEFSQTWLAIAGPLWMIAVAAAALVAPPSYVNVPTVPDRHRGTLTGLLHITIAVQLVIMIWRPGV